MAAVLELGPCVGHRGSCVGDLGSLWFGFQCLHATHSSATRVAISVLRTISCNKEENLSIIVKMKVRELHHIALESLSRAHV